MELKFKSLEDLQSYLTEVDMIELEELTELLLTEADGREVENE